MDVGRVQGEPLKKKAGGYTLVELLITLAISGLIFVVVGTVMFQLSTVSGDGNDKLSVVHEVQNAQYWFNLDGQTAMSATGGASLVLAFPAGQTVTYSLTGKSLQRVEGSSTMTLAQNISSLSFSVQARLVSMDITSSISGRTDVSEQNTYKVYLRPVQP
jgi:prepilin-type N-terminal cleavage/methylation domain-containing protein